MQLVFIDFLDNIDFISNISNIVLLLLLNNTMRNEPRSDYEYSVDGSVIAIEDLDLGNRSVTNDIQNVVNDIRKELGANLTMSGYSIVYKDSMGRYDGVMISENGNASFYPLGESDLEKAKSRLLHVNE